MASYCGSGGYRKDHRRRHADSTNEFLPFVWLTDPQSTRGLAPSGVPKPDGSFEIQHILPGTYQVDVMTPPGLDVKSIRYGGQDLTKSLLDVVPAARST